MRNRGGRIGLIAAMALSTLVGLSIPWAAPAAAAPNGKILFTRGEERPAVYSINPDGTGLVREIRDADSPSWSPDASKIAFVRDVGKGNNSNTEIFVLTLGARKPIQLTDAPAGDGSPDWSPDGSQIVWERDGDLWVMNADGTNQHSIFALGVSKNPAWGPQPTVAFSSQPPGQTGFNIYVVNADGTGTANQLTGDPANPDTNDETDPAWSPSGNRIVYAARSFPQTDFDIWVMNADGSGQAQLFRTPLSDDDAPTWSPDGTKIAFECDLVLDLDQDICTMDANGSGEAAITSKGFDHLPDWGRGEGPSDPVYSFSDTVHNHGPNAGQWLHLSIPEGTDPGDLMILAVMNEAAPNSFNPGSQIPTTPAGWTSVDTRGLMFTASARLAYKVATTEDTPGTLVESRYWDPAITIAPLVMLGYIATYDPVGTVVGWSIQDSGHQQAPNDVTATVPEPGLTSTGATFQHTLWLATSPGPIVASTTTNEQDRGSLERESVATTGDFFLGASDRFLPAGDPGTSASRTFASTGNTVRAFGLRIIPLPA